MSEHEKGRNGERRRTTASPGKADPAGGDLSGAGYTRKDFLRICGRAGLAVTALTVGTMCGRLSPELSFAAGKEDVLRIGYIPITDATPLLIAYAKGFYAEEGIKAERPVLIRGWSTLSEAFMSKKFNFTHLLLPIPIYMRYNLDFPVKVVAWDHLNNSAITVGGKSGINSLRDLGGKRIAIPYWYSMHNIILQFCLKKYGIRVVTREGKTLEDDETYLFTMNPPDMPTAMARGSIDGYIVAEPFNAAGEIFAKGRIIRFTGDIWQNHPCCVAVMREEDIRMNPEWCQRVVDAVVKAELWSKNNMEEAARILSKEGDGYLPLPEKVIARAMMKYDLDTYGTEKGTGAITHADWPVSRIGFQPYQFKSNTVKVVEYLKETVMEGDVSFLDKVSPEFVSEDLMNYEMVTKAILKAGGMKRFDGIGRDDAPFARDEIISV
jgi:NitT/TauT family transport system substrate-binding protein